VHNALGYAYFNMEKTDMAINEYQQAVEKQPGCAVGCNTTGNWLCLRIVFVAGSLLA